MAETTIVIPSGTRLDEELERIATETGHAKDEMAVNARNAWLEDLADARSALEVIARNDPTISLEELRREFGLEC